MNVFELVENTPKQVVIKVNADDPLTVARHPYVSGDYAYITVTKGDKHVMTIIKKDSKTFSFHWGSGGYTLISENLERLRTEVCKFIRKNYIMLEWIGENKPSEMNIFYNSNFHSWELTARNNDNRGTACWFSDGASWRDVANEATMLFPDCDIRAWHKGIAQTGIDVWRAEL